MLSIPVLQSLTPEELFRFYLALLSVPSAGDNVQSIKNNIKELFTARSPPEQHDKLQSFFTLSDMVISTFTNIKSSTYFRNLLQVTYSLNDLYFACLLHHAVLLLPQECILPSASSFFSLLPGFTTVGTSFGSFF